jgi:hypothetical protein
MATYIKIASNTVGAGGVASVTFSSIPSTYTDLVIKISARQNVAFANAYLQFNGSTGANYSYRRLRGDGSGVSSATAASQTSADTFASVGRSSFTANTFSNAEIYVPNYTSANFKSFSIDSVNENNATAADMALNADLWSQTAAITSVTLLADSGANYVQYSTFTLYGISNA